MSPELHGKNGFRQVLVNALGRTCSGRPVRARAHSEAPTAGDDLMLSIDLATQQAAEQALGDTPARWSHRPSNGDALALASKPGSTRRRSRAD